MLNNYVKLVLRHITIRITSGLTPHLQLCLFFPCLNRRANGLQGTWESTSSCWSSHLFAATPTSKVKGFSNLPYPHLASRDVHLVNHFFLSECSFHLSPGPSGDLVIFQICFFISWRCNRTSETLVGRRPRSRSPLHGEPLLFSGSVSESLQLTESLVGPQLHVHHTKVVGESCSKVQQNTLARYHQKMWRPGTLIEFLHFLTNISTNCCSDFRLYQQASCRPLIYLLISAYSWLPPSGCLTTNSQPGIPKSSSGCFRTS